jgi:hypothetical protein
MAQTIEQIQNHLKAGNEVALITYTRVTLFDARHIEYIRADADGKGFRLGWPGKKSIYCFENQLRMVPAGMTLKRSKK